jgi:hypothetical protein
MFHSDKRFIVGGVRLMFALKRVSRPNSSILCWRQADMGWRLIQCIVTRPLSAVIANVGVGIRVSLHVCRRAVSRTDREKFVQRSCLSLSIVYIVLQSAIWTIVGVCVPYYATGSKAASQSGQPPYHQGLGKRGNPGRTKDPVLADPPVSPKPRIVAWLLVPK